jgi:hypothetical protein
MEGICLMGRWVLMTDEEEEDGKPKGTDRGGKRDRIEVGRDKKWGRNRMATSVMAKREGEAQRNPGGRTGPGATTDPTSALPPRLI